MPQDLAREDRLAGLLQHLGLSQAHFATRQTVNLTGLMHRSPSAAASVIFVAPSPFQPKLLANHAPRMLCIRGDHGPGAAVVGRTTTSQSSWG